MSNIVIVKVFGGLGNQLFQFAFAKAYQLKNNCNVYIDSSTGFRNDPYKREFLLDQFNISLKESPGLFFKFYRIRLFRIIFKLLKFPNFIHQKIPFKSFRPHYLKKNHEKISILQGYWQSPLYFKDYQSLVKKDLKIKVKIKKNTKFVAKLIKKNSVALCFRFFQEVKNLNRNNLNDAIYYTKAIKMIKQKIKNPEFYIFCDNNNLAKNFIREYLPELKNDKFIFERSKNFDAIQKLYLLKKFKNFILSDSTFHWWGAYLSNGIDISIGPKSRKDFFPKHWILI